MGMTIDEHIKTLESYGKGRKGFTGQPIDFQASINFAINTMRKYQKIQEIMDELNGDFYGSYLKDRQTLEKIWEVIEDGNDI